MLVKWEIVKQPVYIPDLALSSVYQNEGLLERMHFDSDKNLKKTMFTYVNKLVALEYDTRI